MGCQHTGCECTEPGWCQRHGIHKPRRWFELCQTDAKYFAKWEQRQGPGHDIAGRPPSRRRKVRAGPGTELTRLLRRMGIRYTPGCRCKDHSVTMDVWGPDKCEARMETILGWLQQEARKRHLPFVRPAARMLVRRAIKLARRAEEVKQR